VAVVERKKHNRSTLIEQGKGTVLEGAAGEALGVDVGDLLDLERALLRNSL